MVRLCGGIEAVCRPESTGNALRIPFFVYIYFILQENLRTSGKMDHCKQMLSQTRRGGTLDMLNFHIGHAAGELFSLKSEGWCGLARSFGVEWAKS